MTGRIAYLTSRYPGTTHTFIRREIESLREQGIAVETFSVRRPRAAEIVAPEDLKAHQTTFYLVPSSLSSLLCSHVFAVATKPSAYVSTLIAALRHRPPGAKGLLWSIFHFVEAIVLAPELRRRKVTHLHNHFANAGATVGYLTSRFLSLPWSLTLHGISETDYPAGLLLAEKVRAATFVACVSWFGRAQAMRLVPPDQWHKFTIVRCALDLKSMPRAVSKPSSEVPQIICVGRLSSEKGHYGLLTALALARKRGFATHLTLVGDGPEEAALKAYATDLLPPDSITFAGRHDEADTLKACADADLLVLPSFMEGLPVVLMEAMALGTPVIASRVAGVPELITDGVEGRLFTVADWDELAHVLVDALTDTDKTRSMTIAARAKIERQFEIKTAVAPLIERFI